MKIIQNLIGSFSLVLLLVGCNKKVDTNEATTGQQIVYENFGVFLSDLPKLTHKDGSSMKEPDTLLCVEISDVVNYDKEWACSSCQKFKGNYTNFTITKIPFDTIPFTLPLNVNPSETNKNIKIILVNNIDQTKEKYKIIDVFFSDFYIDNNEQNASIAVEKGIRGDKNYTKEIFYFKKINNEWFFINKELISIS